MTAPSSSRQPPKLNTRQPLRHGLFATVGAAIAAAAIFAVDVDQGPVASAVAVRRAEPVVVRHDAGGALAHLHVAVGADVEAGTLIAQLDRRHIESELAALRKRIDAKRMEIDGLRQEAAALSGGGDRSSMRARIAALDSEVTDADRVIVGHSTRIALLDGQLDRMDIRAPVAGRIVEVAQASIGAQIAAKSPIAVIRPSASRLQVDVAWPASAGAQPSIGQTVRVWPAGSLGLGGTYLGAVESLGADAFEAPTSMSPGSNSVGPRARIVLDVAGTSLADARDAPPLLHVQLITGTKSLAEHLFAPLYQRRPQFASKSESLRP